MMSNLIKLFLLTVIVGCKENVSNKKMSCAEIRDLQRKVVLEGNQSAYFTLYRSIYDNKGSIPSPMENIYYSLVMADEYNNGEACFDVYSNIMGYESEFGDMSLQSTDDVKPEFLAVGIMYLKKGVELKNKECMFFLGKHLLSGKYVKKDSLRALELLRNSNYQGSSYEDAYKIK